jgi:hypothetical protein
MASRLAQSLAIYRRVLMLFSSFLPSLKEPDPQRLTLLGGIMLDFGRAFPDLHFELRLDRRVINAQAINLGDKRCVLVYGGIALHPSLAEASLTFVFLHEAGHHLGRGPRLPFDLTLACDCVADYWATAEGADILYRESGRPLNIGKALIELEDLMSNGQKPENLLQPETPNPNCWNRRWPERRKAIGAGRFPNKTCALMLT